MAGTFCDSVREHVLMSFYGWFLWRVIIYNEFLRVRLLSDVMSHYRGLYLWRTGSKLTSWFAKYLNIDFPHLFPSRALCAITYIQERWEGRERVASAPEPIIPAFNVYYFYHYFMYNFLYLLKRNHVITILFKMKKKIYFCVLRVIKLDVINLKI